VSLTIKSPAFSFNNSFYFEATLQDFNSVPVTTLNFQQGKAAGGSVGPKAECRTGYGSAEQS